MKAFNSIHRGKMKTILHAYGLPPLFIEVIICLNENTETVVLSADDGSGAFGISTGVLQGDTLQP